MSAAEKRTRRAASFNFLKTVLQSDWIKDFSLAVDGGANVGAWTLEMGKHFDRVWAFEPALEIFTTLRASTCHVESISCMQVALLDRETRVDIMAPPGKSLRSLYVQPAEAGGALAIPLDGLFLTSCGFIKLDLEGAEYPALRGARQTIKRFRPTLMLEMDRFLPRRFGGSLEQTEQYLTEKLGYVQVADVRPDRVYLPRERAP